MNKYSEIKATLDNELQGLGLAYTKKPIRGGIAYRIETSDLICVVTLTTDDVGYDLSVKENVLGTAISYGVNNDAYGLEYDNNVTQELVDETVACMKAIAHKGIYTGRLENEVLLAIPLPNGNYVLKRSKLRRKWWQFDASITQDVSRRELLSLGKDIKLLK